MPEKSGAATLSRSQADTAFTSETEFQGSVLSLFSSPQARTACKERKMELENEF